MRDCSRMSSPEALPSPEMAGGVKTLICASGYFAAIARIFDTIELSDISGALRSSHGRSGKNIVATFSPFPPMKLAPSMETALSSPGIFLISSVIGSTTSLVRDCEAPSGSCTVVKTMPWSSSGMNSVGSVV